MRNDFYIKTFYISSVTIKLLNRNGCNFSFVQSNANLYVCMFKKKSTFNIFYFQPCSTGQQVVEEILDAQTPGCPREFFNIPVKSSVTPQFDPENKGNVEMPVFRSRYDQRTGLSPNNPRQQVIEVKF